MSFLFNLVNHICGTRNGEYYIKAIKPGKKIPSGVYQIMLIYRNKKMFNRQVIL